MTRTLNRKNKAKTWGRGALYSKLDIMLEYKKHRKRVFFQGEACTARAMFRVSKTAKIKKKGMIF